MVYIILSLSWTICLFLNVRIELYIERMFEFLVRILYVVNARESAFILNIVQTFSESLFIVLK